MSIPIVNILLFRKRKKLTIPIVGNVDTNCDPDDIDYIIPGNDDAIRAIKLFASKFADAVLEGRKRFEEKLTAESNKETQVIMKRLRPPKQIFRKVSRWKMSPQIKYRG